MVSRSLCKTSGLIILQPAANAHDQTVIIQTGGGTTLLMRPRSIWLTVFVCLFKFCPGSLALQSRTAVSPLSENCSRFLLCHAIDWASLPWLALTSTLLFVERLGHGTKHKSKGRTLFFLKNTFNVSDSLFH